MNILKKNIAPVTEKAWQEIQHQASTVFDHSLTARNFVEIDGPKGLESGGRSTGRLLMPENQSKKGINYGLREVQPYIEIRKPFELSIWELDNLERGAKDVNLKPLEKAAREVAQFEDDAIYKGFKPGAIEGLEKSAGTSPVKLPGDPDAFLKVIGEQIIHLQESGVEGPYSLVINSHKWQNLVNLSKGYPILKQLKEILGGQVIINHRNTNSYLVSERGDDYELSLGQDLSVGYDSHTNEKVKLYFTESFTFRVLTPEAISVFTN